MTQRILVELALFLIPFAIFFFYRLASRELRVRDRWPLTSLVLIGGGIAVAGLIIGPLLTPSDQGKCYQAARYENGVTIPAKTIPCEEVTAPEHGDGSSTQPAPVAPRDNTPVTPRQPAPAELPAPEPAPPPAETPTAPPANPPQ